MAPEDLGLSFQAMSVSSQGMNLVSHCGPHTAGMLMGGTENTGTKEAALFALCTKGHGHSHAETLAHFSAEHRELQIPTCQEQAHLGASATGGKGGGREGG